jgi:hypothetical protein
MRPAEHAAALRALRVPLPRAKIVAEGERDGWVEAALGRRPCRRNSPQGTPRTASRSFVLP